MSNAIVRKDLLGLRRDKLPVVLFSILAILVASSLLAGLQRERAFDRERAAALETDRAVWLNQGERNPHSAAHFSRYAFRPASPLAMIEPGTTDFAGLAIWMEAHYQDPAVFRRAEDGGELSRYTQLSPAFLVLTIAPVVVFLLLFGSIAGEREDGTLRQVLASGVTARKFFTGKMGIGSSVVFIAYTAVFLPIAALSVFVSPAEFTADSLLRLSVLFLVYGAYLVVCVAIALGVSACTRTRQAAFLALTVIWALMAVFLPRLAADVATGIHPQPDAREASERLSAASDTYYRDTNRRARIEQEVLDRYDVASVEELPINYGAYVLQVSEELSEPEFDAFYADLDARYAGQEQVIRLFGLLTPVVASTKLSRGVAGTDRAHQRDFAQATEAHRREMIRLLNKDYMYNAGEAGYGYTADRELWARFEDLEYQLPRLARLGGSYLPDALLLCLWLAGSLAFAYWSVCQAAVGEESAA